MALDPTVPSPVMPSPPSRGGVTRARVLPIAPGIRQTEVWCWAASAEMVFRYYGLPNLNPAGNYECGIVGSWFANTPYAANCGLCEKGVVPMLNQLQVMLGHGPFARAVGVPSRVVSARLVFRALTTAEIKVELDAGRPIVVGIAPGGGLALPNILQHGAVLFGYAFDAMVPSVIVNDSSPFDVAPYAQRGNPYQAQGGVRFRAGPYRVPPSG